MPSEMRNKRTIYKVVKHNGLKKHIQVTNFLGSVTLMIVTRFSFEHILNDMN